MLKNITFILISLIGSLALASGFGARDEYELYIGVAKRSIASAQNHKDSAQNSLIAADDEAAQINCKKSLEYVNEAQKSLDRFFSLPSSLVLSTKNKEVYKSDYRSSYSNLVEKQKSLKDSIDKSCKRILAAEGLPESGIE